MNQPPPPTLSGIPGVLITASVVQNLLSGVSLRIMPSWSHYVIMSILALLITAPWWPGWFAIFGGAVIVLYLLFALNMALPLHVRVPAVGPVLSIIHSPAQASVVCTGPGSVHATMLKVHGETPAMPPPATTTCLAPGLFKVFCPAHTNAQRRPIPAPGRPVFLSARRVPG